MVREEAVGVTMYAHVGTGNYNSRTAKLYTDFGLFTADPKICGDLLRVFNFLTGDGELGEDHARCVKYARTSHQCSRAGEGAANGPFFWSGHHRANCDPALCDLLALHPRQQ